MEHSACNPAHNGFKISSVENRGRKDDGKQNASFLSTALGRIGTHKASNPSVNKTPMCHCTEEEGKSGREEEDKASQGVEREGWSHED